MNELDTLRAEHEVARREERSLNMERGQPADENFDLSLPLLSAVGEDDIVTDAGIDIRNYPGGVAGLAEARALFAPVLGARADEVIVGGSSSLELMSHVLSWALLRGVNGSAAPWVRGPAKLIVTVPGYDRHFGLAEALGYELVAVPIGPQGPDMDAVERLAADDAAIKGIYFVPNHSNPTGDSLSSEAAARLTKMPTAAPDFTVFADDAYAVHHLVEPEAPAPPLLRVAEAAGNPERVIVFGSTSKVTFASAGLAFMAASVANVRYWSALFSAQSIGPNKAEQWRHVRFLGGYPDGIAGLMRDHARILAPKFAAVAETLELELGNRGLARWSAPRGGYFVSLDTDRPVADRVVALAREAGVALTPTGATFPGGVDPGNRNIRLAPTRPSLEDVREAMGIVCRCVRLASAEHDATHGGAASDGPDHDGSDHDSEDGAAATADDT